MSKKYKEKHFFIQKQILVNYVRKFLQYFEYLIFNLLMNNWNEKCPFLMGKKDEGRVLCASEKVKSEDKKIFSCII